MLNVSRQDQRNNPSEKINSAVKLATINESENDHPRLKPMDVAVAIAIQRMPKNTLDAIKPT